MISVSQLDSLRERYIVERPQYVELAERASSMLKAETRRRGLACTIESRAKDVPSTPTVDRDLHGLLACRW